MRGISRRLFQLFALTFAAIIFLQSSENLWAKEKKNKFWTYVKPVQPIIPKNAGWGHNVIDFFIFQKMKGVGLSPEKEASKEEWLRRVTFDLTGLPPSITEIDSFLNDDSNDAFDTVVNKLLGSSRYGERMAAWWLDGARYGDSHGYDNDLENSQWPWRNWVIESFNKNKPFNVFTIEQLAGDLLPNPSNDQLIATGFNRNHRIQTEGGAIDEEWRTEYVIDRVETMGTVWMGLTLSCARCHDHKYDPITQREFYELFAFFNNLDEKGFINNLRGSADPKVRYKEQEFNHEVSKIRSNESEKSDQDKKISEIERSYPYVMVMREMPERRKAFILKGGQYDSVGEEVFPDLPSSLSERSNDSLMNRMDLAKWLVDGNHPLTSRVIVNRIWALFFGTGIVSSTENFGVRSSPPSNSKLLDWIAVDFVENGWDIKRLIKQITMSAAYRQKHAVNSKSLKVDPDNRLISRGPRLRLESEMIRDQALFVSGLLVDKIGGPSYWVYQPVGLWRDIEKRGTFKQDHGEKLYRRSLYSRIRRTVPNPSMAIFDMPSREVCNVKRSSSNTPLQALSLLNSVTHVEAAKKLGERMMQLDGDLEDKIYWGFRSVTSRSPEDFEVKVLVDGYRRRLSHFESDHSQADALLKVGESDVLSSLSSVELAAMTTVANVLLNLDEAINK
jgi:hypothetical protein